MRFGMLRVNVLNRFNMHGVAYKCYEKNFGFVFNIWFLFCLSIFFLRFIKLQMIIMILWPLPYILSIDTQKVKIIYIVNTSEEIISLHNQFRTLRWKIFCSKCLFQSKSQAWNDGSFTMMSNESSVVIDYIVCVKYWCIHVCRS